MAPFMHQQFTLTLTFTFCLCRTSRSDRGENRAFLGLSWVCTAFQIPKNMLKLFWIFYVHLFPQFFLLSFWINVFAPVVVATADSCGIKKNVSDNFNKCPGIGLFTLRVLWFRSSRDKPWEWSFSSELLDRLSSTNLFKNNFIDLFLAVLDLCCCAGFSLVVASGRYPLVMVL